MGRPREKGRGKAGQSDSAPPRAGNYFGGGGYSSFGDYMVEKNRKLKEQLHPGRANEQGDGMCAEGASPAKAQIFRGLTFWMTGRTCLPDHEIKRLIVEHGGTYEQYGFSRVSHIIADNLATGNQTWRELKARVKRGHVVTSSWIVDCTKELRRIPEVRYMPKCLASSSSMLNFVSERSKEEPRSEGPPEGFSFQVGGSAASAPGSGGAHCSDPPRPSGVGVGTQNPTSPGRESNGMSEVQPVGNDTLAACSRKRPLSPTALTQDSLAQLDSAGADVAVSAELGHSETTAGLGQQSANAMGKNHEAGSPVLQVAEEHGEASAGIARACPSMAAFGGASAVPSRGTPLALEISASCATGLSDKEHLFRVVEELAGEVSKASHEDLGALGLRVAIDPPEEWSCEMDLDEHSTVSEGSVEDKAVMLRSSLRKLATRMVAGLSLDGSAHGWSDVRRVAATLRFSRSSTLAAAAHAPERSRDAPGASQLATLIASQEASPPPSLVTVAASQRGIRIPNASAEGCAQATEPRTPLASPQVVTINGIETGSSHCHREALMATSGSSTRTAPARRRWRRLSRADAADGSCGASAQSVVSSASGCRQVSSRISEPPAVDPVAIQELAEALRVQFGICSTGSTSVKALLEHARRATSSEALFSYAGALRLLLNFQEYDVALVVLRLLRAASGTAPGSAWGKALVASRPTREVQTEQPPAAFFFNRLLREANHALAQVSPGALFDVKSLPVQTADARGPCTAV
mmetsp:Transcript_56764/g.122688  ORF Transcript_56764/g.122688 Transcript_56764/m.122688 type:complete len:752 (+) Transcript_56764:78-2333(+)